MNNSQFNTWGTLATITLIPVVILIFSATISLYNHTRAMVVELHAIKMHLIAQTELQQQQIALQQRQSAALEALVAKVKPAKTS